MSDSDQDDTQKTEDPTPKKLEESRKKGQVALSRELNTWLMLLTVTVLIATSAASIMGRLRDHMRVYIEHAHDMPQIPGGFSAILGGSFWSVVGILTLPLLVLMVAAFLGPFLQIGPLFAPDIIKPDLSKVSPAKGVKRLFSMRALVEFTKGILKLGIVTVVGMILLMPFYDRVDHLVGIPMSLMLHEMQILIVRLMIGVLVVLIVVAVIDVLFQRSDHHKKMRMSTQEIKDEYKQTEGDPHVKAKLRQLRSERARQRMMQAVPEADVVITNPTHYSIALKYNPEEMDAPILVAKGVDDVAFRIRDMAKEHGIIIYESPPLARALYDTVDINDIVPAEHYKAVAEVISYVFKLKGRLN